MFSLGDGITDEYSNHLEAKMQKRAIKVDYDQDFDPRLLTYKLRRDVYDLIVRNGAKIFANPAVEWDIPNAMATEADAFVTDAENFASGYMRQTTMESLALRLYLPNHTPSRIISKAVEEFLVNHVFLQDDWWFDTSVETLLYFDEYLRKPIIEGEKRRRLLYSHKDGPRYCLSHHICFGEILKPEEIKFIKELGNSKHKKLLELYQPKLD